MIDMKEICACGASFEYDTINDEIKDMYNNFLKRHSKCIALRTPTLPLAKDDKSVYGYLRRRYGY